MTEKSFNKLLNKLQKNDAEIFDTFEEQFGGFDVDALYSIVKDYEYDNLGEIILSTMYDCVENDDDFYDKIKSAVSISGDDIDSSGPSIITSYFNEIKKVYNKYNNNYDIKFNVDTREKVISMNLKTVITIAKRYQGYGPSLEDLIASGNEGLIKAFGKFDPDRNDTLIAFKESLTPLKEKFNWTALSKATNSILNYGAPYKKFTKEFASKKSITKEEVIKWAETNIKPASFNSVASFWITAEIKKTLSNYTKGPERKDETYTTLSEELKELKDELAKTKDEKKRIALQEEINWMSECVSKIKPSLNNNVRIDAPVSASNSTGGEMDLNNVIQSVEIEEDEEEMEFEKVIDKNRFYDILEKLFGDCKQRDKRVFKKSFGIEYPGKLSAADIAQQEGISVARVSQIVNSTLEVIKQNIEEQNLSKDYLYSLLN